ncbi:tripartite tricarboxylate transporter TctB family protein [Seohaeicola zhoushanensis]|uniref:DUF1468 domain-containing protein n=1 Tax=Seohaeicola zhoushanensis TaxID=1569283 RepID=A0A8J3M918_9RHOB|nr:tripartite tricarboxylate transporter TctB family protein [Seohaeicola zhoushanensis]GHF64446.1 hypothetical protein GCM10017056_39670 [Seohaeicola zhoushanensis]
MILRLIPGLVTVLIGILLVAVVVPNGIDDPGFTQPHSLAPGDFPTHLAWLVLITGLLLLAFGALGAPTEAVSPGEIRAARALPFAAALLGFVLLIPVIGIEAGTFTFTLALFVFTADIGWGRGLAVAAGFAIAIHIIFIELAGVPMPSTLRLLF